MSSKSLYFCDIQSILTEAGWTAPLLQRAGVVWPRPVITSSRSPVMRADTVTMEGTCTLVTWPAPGQVTGSPLIPLLQLGPPPSTTQVTGSGGEGKRLQFQYLISIILQDHRFTGYRSLLVLKALHLDFWLKMPV